VGGNRNGGFFHLTLRIGINYEFQESASALNTDSGRINDPEVISPAEVSEAVATRERLVIQFSHRAAYSLELLQNLNEACRLTGGRVQVRFYGHYGARFDAAVLRHLPEVQNLAVDCLQRIENEDEIGKLPKLESLSFGVFELDRPDFLNSLNLGQLTRLTLSGTRKRNIDLAPLGRCPLLTELLVNGHAKGIAAIANLPTLHKLTLSAFAKSNGLGFIAAMPSLVALTLILGGRHNLDDLASTTVQMLQILRVRGVETLGDLSRFPALRALRVEDQLQMTELNLSGANLERLWLYNCKNLSSLHGLDRQERLREFFASRVALDMDALRDREWPPSATSVQLFSGSKKWNDAAKHRLAAGGLDGKNSYWP
jgi:hypothetical protein